jgi:hypothetical protein
MIEMPSLESIVLPMATRLGVSVVAGISMFNEKAMIFPSRSTQPDAHLFVGFGLTAPTYSLISLRIKFSTFLANSLEASCWESKCA